jgi:gliding motility-associated-like protein
MLILAKLYEILYAKMKRFSLVAWCILFISLFANKLEAQTLISGPDTMCIGNNMTLFTTAQASSYYWGFCSAYLNNIPTGSSINAGTGLSAPSSIASGKDNGNYYMFVVNNNVPFSLIRYDYGNSLSNVPVASDMGNFSANIPAEAKGFEILQTGGNWYGFILAGNGIIDAKIVRLEFGNSLANTPVVTDMGNLNGALENPQDIFMFYEANNWYAFTTNGTTNTLVRLEFGNTITNQPAVVDLANPGNFNQPTGINGVFDGANWHVFVVNKGTNMLSRLDFGVSLLGPFIEANLGNFGGLLNSPRDITTIKDCGKYYGYITNEGNNTMTLINFDNVLVPTSSVNLLNFAGFNQPRYFTKFLRDKDLVYCFTANRGDNSISRLSFISCQFATQPKAFVQNPPTFTYTTPGLYNVYLVLDEGLPTMRVDCKLITVLPKPRIEVSNDTLICQGDTLLLVTNGPGLFSNIWDPAYNAIPPYDTTSIFIHPNEDYTYHTHLEFTSDGSCAYDTNVTVKVSRIVADAGEDRYVADGAYTILGGEHMSVGQEYSYVWTPPLYLDNINKQQPICTPQDVQPYYVTVTNDSSGCVRTDSVWVFSECTDLNLPNAFNPNSDIPINRNFGMMNSRIFKLEYFKIFNRWGQAIFETTDPKKKWDGTFNNIEMPPGTYVWIIDGYCTNGKRFKRTGTVLLAK